ncbi:Alpha/Beta hydrolase protein, partial [Elsinoe ampelina]
MSGLSRLYSLATRSTGTPACKHPLMVHRSPLLGRTLSTSSRTTGLPSLHAQERRAGISIKSHRCSISNDATTVLSELPALVVVPSVLVGISLALWTLKCMSLVLFQNKIIYMPSLPPYTRREKLEDYQSMCGKVKWREESIISNDGYRLAIAVGEIGQDIDHKVKPSIVILYFQGNGSSTPPRLPLLSRAAASVYDATHSKVIICALSYRGYWKSTGSPSQSGIEIDAQSFLAWAADIYPSSQVIIWGQSIGAGVASTALATYVSKSNPAQPINVKGLILETPFVNIRRMLVELYPQKWLPYRHLWPFLRSHWDSEVALRKMKNSRTQVPPILLLPAADDEVVPRTDAAYLEKLCHDLGLAVSRVSIHAALHHQASEKPQGRKAITEFIK